MTLKMHLIKLKLRKNMKFQLMTTCIAALFILFAGTSVHAQFEPPAQAQDVSEVTDEELQTFVDASIKAQQIQAEAQMEMIAIVEEEGLEVDTYNRILQGMQTGQSAEQMDVSSSDVEKFEVASSQISEIEEEMEGELIAAIEDEGLELNRFQEIFMAVQTDAGLQQKMQELIQQAQMQMQQQ